MTFGAVRALDGVSLSFEPGEVHGIIGENGAGKSTLMKILSGVQRPTSGGVLWEDKSVELGSVGAAQDLGIVMIHQELNLVGTISVAGNIFLGRELKKGGLLDEAGMNARAKELLDQVGADFGPTALVRDLSVARQQLVEIAKAISFDARVIIMDEPTAVLSDRESEALFALIGRLKERGVTVLYISHRLVEVERLCDRVSVLRDGQFVTTIPQREATPDQMATLMVGRELGDVFPALGPAPKAEPILFAEHLADGHAVEDVSLTLRPGEIVGLAGLIGSGRTETAEMLFGARPRKAGTLKVNGKEVAMKSPKEAVKAGIAYVSEDRKHTGLHLSLSVLQNLSMASLRRHGAYPLQPESEATAAKKGIEELDIRLAHAGIAVGSLSGGNQQKVSIGKWLATEPQILILDEPTRGVDIGAKREIYQLIHNLAASGKACLLISSELNEILGLCHRVIVLREGRVAGELTGKLEEEAVMKLAAGVTA